MSEWIKTKDNPPTEEGEILFIPKDNITEERIGIVIPGERYALLRRTDIDFKDIEYWMPIPRDPRDEK
jgi:hypothetical protein